MNGERNYNYGTVAYITHQDNYTEFHDVTNTLKTTLSLRFLQLKREKENKEKKKKEITLVDQSQPPS